MGGKHRPEGTAGAPVGKIVAVVAAVLVVIGIVAAAQALTGDDGSAQTAAASAGQTPDRPSDPHPATMAPSAGADGQTATDTATATETASPAPSPSDDPEVVALLAACRSEVAAREKLLSAAKASFRDWSSHVGAQIGLDNGTKTIEQARKQWADSKARGPADLAAYSSAESALAKANGGCGKLDKADTSSFSETDAATACVARAAGLAKTQSVGKTVNNAWAAHVEMMKHKEHTNHADYSKRWLAMVRDSSGYLAAFSKATSGLAGLPACSA